MTALATAPARRRRASPYRLVEAPSAPEHPTHKAIARLLTLEIARAGHVSRQGVCWWTVDLAAYTNGIPYTHQARGCIAGIWEVFILHRGRAHFVEVKTHSDLSALGETQKAIGAAVLASGGRCGIAREPGEMVALLDAWQIPRNRRTHLDARGSA